MLQPLRGRRALDWAMVALREYDSPSATRATAEVQRVVWVLVVDAVSAPPCRLPLRSTDTPRLQSSFLVQPSYKTATLIYCLPDGVLYMLSQSGSRTTDLD